LLLDNINILLAKLKPSQYREYWKIWNEKFRHRYDEIFGDKNRIYLPIDINYNPTKPTADEDEVTTESRITHLTLTIRTAFSEYNYPKMYICTDKSYTDGYAYEVKLNPKEYSNDEEYRMAISDKSYDLFVEAKHNRISETELKSMRMVKIGKIIEDIVKFTSNVNTNEKFNRMLKLIKSEFNTRQTKISENKFLVCISRHPYDIAGMSTDRRWVSCMTLPGDKKKPEGGMFYEYVHFDITEGTLVAYLIDENDKNITHPYARIAIKPYYNYYDKNDILLVPEPTVYSDRKEGLEPFQATVKNWVEKVQGRKLGLFKFNKKLYRDTSKGVVLKYDDEYIHELQKTILADDETIKKIIHNFPWFTEAYVENAVVKILERPSGKLVLNMQSGTWIDGYWVDGFLSKEVVWKNGIWRDGIFNGIWEDGIWLDGTWHGKEWKSGEWRVGRIISGKYNNTYTSYKSIIDPKEFKKYENKADTPTELENELFNIKMNPEFDFGKHLDKFEKYMDEEDYKNKKSS